MKKTILGIVLTMVLMSTYLVILLSSTNHKHEVELNKVKIEYENKIKEKILRFRITKIKSITLSRAKTMT